MCNHSWASRGCPVALTAGVTIPVQPCPGVPPVYWWPVAHCPTICLVWIYCKILLDNRKEVIGLWRCSSVKAAKVFHRSKQVLSLIDTTFGHLLLFWACQCCDGRHNSLIMAIISLTYLQTDVRCKNALCFLWENVWNCPLNKETWTHSGKKTKVMKRRKLANQSVCECATVHAQTCSSLIVFMCACAWNRSLSTILWDPSCTCGPIGLWQWDRLHIVECLLPFKHHYYLLLHHSPCPLLPGVHIG